MQMYFHGDRIIVVSIIYACIIHAQGIMNNAYGMCNLQVVTAGIVIITT